MWSLLLIAIHITNPNDIPGRVELLFSDKESCEKVLSTMTYQLKFHRFKVTGECKLKQF